MAYLQTQSLMTVGFSGLTSVPYFVGDADTISLSLITATTESTYTIQGTASDGFTAAIPANEWSTLTLLTAQGVFGIQPGVRWIRSIESASNSSATLLVAQKVFV